MLSTNKTIVKNTLFLYLRMLLTMAVSFYSSRIILEQLGVSDYGVYNLVGGIVAIFGFFNSSMASATQRYLTIDIGKEDHKQLQKTFSATLTIHLGIATMVVILAETIGLWYVNNIMVFADERAFAVNVVYQFSIATAFFGIIQIPYDALIIAKERMNIHAYVSILEAVLKLLVVFMLVYFDSDKLITYSILIFLVSVVIRMVFQNYCRRNFKESRYLFEYEKRTFNDLLGFTGWNSLGSIALLVSTQGNNILLNLFFGTAVNASFGITMMVQGIILSFVHNFQIAVNPQIVKLFARKDYGQMHNLILTTSKLSFYLLLVITTPIFLNTAYILKLWLKVVPPGVVMMVDLALVNILLEILSFSLITGIQAMGKIKHFQIALGTLVFLNLPISYITLKMGSEPYSIFIVMILTSVFALLFRLFYANLLLGLKTGVFVRKVILPVLSVLFLALFLYWLITEILNISSHVNSILGLIINTAVTCCLLLFLIVFVGLKINERKFLLSFLKKPKP